MRTILFAICFSLGVSLMIISGYVPKSASAQPQRAFDALPDGGERTTATLHYPMAAGTSGPSRSAVDSSTSPAPDPTPTEVPSMVGQEHTAKPVDAPDAQQPKPSPSADDQAEVAANIAAATEGLDDPSAKSEPEANAPVAEAGADHVAWIGWDELYLDGSASQGEGLTYSWKQTSGPAPLKIKAGNRAKATASGLPISTEMDWNGTLYEFELTVTDKHGRTATDSVGCVVLTAPELRVSPPPQRHFELRDGYLLGHYESWATSRDGEPVTFKVSSPVGLTFTKVSGGDYEISGGLTENDRASARYVYKVLVYPTDVQPATMLELLVDTDEKIPGILRLGVTTD